MGIELPFAATFSEDQLLIFEYQLFTKAIQHQRNAATVSPFCNGAQSVWHIAKPELMCRKLPRSRYIAIRSYN
ncbi:hypothetical protein CR918_07105 [Stenotrophomonas indicatrix]|nr:hypothetical protein CR918_07105 [Stenotrophomonas indicatrix]